MNLNNKHEAWSEILKAQCLQCTYINNDFFFCDMKFLSSEKVLRGRELQFFFRRNSFVISGVILRVGAIVDVPVKMTVMNVS